MVFSIPSFLAVGDDYDKKHVLDERSKGRNFVAVAPKQGKLPDALFEKEFHSLHEGDPFVDQLVRERRARNEKARARVSGAPPFKCANPPPKPTGRGSYIGTFQGSIPHETDFIVPRKGDAPPKVEPKRRPIYTAPTKKAGPGQPGRSISGIGEDYVSDFYENHVAVERARAKAGREKMKGAAFKPSGRRCFTFDETTSGVSTCYAMTKPMAPRPKPKEKEPIKGAPEAPWRPAGPIPKKLPPVEYREDPFGGLDPRVPVTKKVLSDKASFKPAGATNNSWYTKSIAFARL